MSYRHLAPKPPIMDRESTYWTVYATMILSLIFLAYAIGY